MKSLRPVPFFRLILPFIGGILCAMYAGVKVEFLLWTLPIIFVISILISRLKGHFSKRWMYGVLLTLLFFLLGFIRYNQTYELNSAQHFSHQILSKTSVFEAEITDMPVVKNERLKVQLKILKTGSENKESVPADGNLLAYLDLDSLSQNLSYGDRIFFRGKPTQIRLPGNPVAFDYRKYLHTQNIHYQLFISESDWVKSAETGGYYVQRQAFKMRKKFLKILRKYLSDSETFSVGSALILGYKDEMNEDIRTAYAQTGAMHVLAVSGLHVGLIYLIISKLFDLLFGTYRRKMRFIKALTCLFGLWLFAMLTGMSPSVMRASVMFSVIIVAGLVRRNNRIYNSLCISALFLLLLNPFMLLSVGFQLSYLAVTGIVYFQPRIYALLICENKFADFLWQLCSVSIAAQLVTLPLSLYYFHQFPVYFWASGLVVVPAASLILSGGLLLFFFETLFSAFAPFIAAAIGFLLYWLIFTVNFCIKALQIIPGSVIEGIWISAFMMFILYVIMLFLVKGINTRKGKYLTAGTAILALVFILTAFEKSKFINNRQIIVYDVYKNSLIDFMCNGTSYSLISNDLKEKSYGFAVKNYHYAQDVNKSEVVNIDISDYNSPALFVKENFVQFFDKKLYLLDKMPQGNKKQIDLDFLIVRNNPYLNLEEVGKYFRCDKIIFDNSNSRYKVEDWKKYCEENAIDYHVVSESGAWIFKF